MIGLVDRCLAALLLCIGVFGAPGCEGASPGSDDAGLSADAHGPDAAEPQELAYELHELASGPVREMSVIDGEEPSFVLLVRGEADDGDRAVLYDSATDEIVAREAPSSRGVVVWAEGPRGDFAMHMINASGYRNDYWKWLREDHQFEPLLRGLATSDFSDGQTWRFPSGVAFGLDEQGLHRVDLREETVALVDEPYDAYRIRHDPEAGRLLLNEAWRDGPLSAYDAATDRRIEIEAAGSRTFGFLHSGRAVYVPERDGADGEGSGEDEARVEFFDFGGADIDGWDGQLDTYLSSDGTQRYLWLSRIEDFSADYHPSAIYHDASGRIVDLGHVRGSHWGVRDDARVAVYEREAGRHSQIVAHLLETDEIFSVGYDALDTWPRFAPQHLSVAVDIEGGGWRLWSKSAGRAISLAGARDLMPGPYGSFWVYLISDASDTYDELLAGVDASSGDTFVLGPEPIGSGTYCSPKIASGGARVFFVGRGEDRSFEAMLWRQAAEQTVTLAEGLGTYGCRDWHIAPGVERGVLDDAQTGRLVGFDGDTPLEIERDVEVTDIWANEDVTSVVYRARDTSSRRQQPFRLKHFDFQTRRVTDVDHPPFTDPTVLEDGRVVYLVREPGCEEDCQIAAKVFWARADTEPQLIHDDVVVYGRGEEDLMVRAGHIFFSVDGSDGDGSERRIRMVASPE